MKYPISKEMHDKIKITYQSDTGNGEIEELAKKLRLPRWKVSRYAIQQGWIAKKKKEPVWSEREIKCLRSSAHLTPEIIQKNLKKIGFKRSVIGIVIKRKRMKLLRSLNGQNATQLAECFGIDVKFITRQIHLGHLKAQTRGIKTAQQGGAMYYIRDLNIKKFIINYVDEIDFRKIDKYWLVDMLTNEKAEH